MRAWIFAGAAAAAVAICCSSISALAQSAPPWTPVTAERVLNPDASDWLSYRGAYDVQGFSRLDQINRTNVQNLRAVWSYAVPDNSRWAPEPLVANGVMYLVEGGGRVLAFNAATGDLIWAHERRYPEDIGVSQGFNRARGLAIYNDKIYWGTADAFMVALDARTGKLVWETKTGDYHTGEGHNHPPLVADGKVFTGHAGGDRGVRSRVRAYDAETGALLWSFNTTPAKGEKGYETWGNRDKIEPVGAAPWNTVSYDPETSTVYFGTGQPSPWSAAIRGAGDALYANTVLAMDANTGRLRWHYQMVPADSWDRAVYESMLVDLTIDGRARKALILTSKVGWGVVLDRTNGQFLRAFRTAYDNTITGWTRAGRPIMNPAAVPKPEDAGSGKVFEICPHFHGARNLQSPSFSAATGLYYLGINNSCMDSRINEIELVASQSHAGGVSGQTKRVPGYDYVGEFVAINPLTGERAWTYRAPGGAAMTASALATAGGIVFGGTVDREFFALDQANGNLLWRTRLNGDVSGGPVTFSVAGRQYVAVPAGGRPAPSTSYAALTNVTLSNGGGAINVFALPDPRDNQDRPPPAPVLREVSGSGPPPARRGGPILVPPGGARPPGAAQSSEATPTSSSPAAAGLFTAAQAARGDAVFRASCSMCHQAAEQTGASFRAKWGNGVAPLFDLIATTMPQTSPGSLPKEDYAAIIAYMLRDSGYPAGASELPADSAALRGLTLPTPAP